LISVSSLVHMSLGEEMIWLQSGLMLLISPDLTLAVGALN
jgi:hypothetical protein